jgi:hypothetical protein
LSFGSAGDAVSGFVAKAFDLPDGVKRVRLTLGGGLAAALSHGDEVLSVHWAGGAPLDETIESGATRLTLLHLQKQEDRYSLELLPVTRDESSPPLARGMSYERVHATAGTLRLDVAPYKVGPAGRFVAHVRTSGAGASDGGATSQPALVGGDGSVQRGSDLPIGMDGGWLTIPHPPGLVLAWVDEAGDPSSGLWGGQAAGPAQDVTLPAVVPLSGNTMRLRLKVAAPTLVHLRAASPMLTRLDRGEGPAEVALHSSGVVLDAYLPGAASEISLRSIAGEMLSGTAELTGTPLTSIGDGLGPRAILPAGGSRAFSFSVLRKGEVGIGVKASSDLATSTLLDASGKVLCSGLIQMPTLEAGTYVLVVRIPETSGPVTIRPAIAGLVPPDTGPPADVIRSYLEKAGLRPASTAGKPAAAPRTTDSEEPEPETSPEEPEPDDQGGE